MSDDLIYNDPMKPLLNWVMGRVEQWEQHRNSNYLTKWDEYYRLWRGIWKDSDKTRDSERSKLISPATQQAIEATVSELEEATFGRGKWFDISDDILDQDKSDAEYIRNLLQEDLEKEKVKDAIAECMLNAAIYGTGIGKIIVEEKTETVPMEQPVAGTLTTIRGTQEIPYVCVKVEPVSPKEFVIDPTATTIDEALGCAQVVIKPKYQITQGMEEGIYEDKPIGSFDKADFGFDEEESTVNNEDDKVKIIEYWGLIPSKFLKANVSEVEEFDYEDDGLVEAVVTIANDSVVLRAVENPFMMKDRPFVAYQHDRVPSKFWGRGIAEKGFNPQKALDAELRARMDALALTTHPMMGLDATRLPRGAKFQVAAGKTVLTNGDPRSVLMPLNFGNIANSTFTQSSELERMVQMGTGAMDSANSNFSNPRNSTASGMSMLQAASIKRQKRTMMNFQETFQNPMIEKVIWRKIQFDPQRYPVVDYKFVPYSTMGIMAKELEMTQMIQLLSMTPQGTPAFFVLLSTIMESTSLNNRAEIVAAIQQMMQPNPLQQQAQQLELQEKMLELEKLKAEVQKLYAQSNKLGVDAGDKASQVNQMKKMIDIEKSMADIENTRSETIRNIPEVEHLQSETILNLAKARGV